MAPALDSGGTFLPKSYTRVALARAGRTSRTSNENNNTSHTQEVVTLILSSRTELVEQGQDEGTARLLGEARLQKLDLRGGIARLLLHRFQGGLRGPLPEA